MNTRIGTLETSQALADMVEARKRRRADIEPLVLSKFNRFTTEFPRWSNLLSELQAILLGNASVRSKLGKFRAIADDIHAALAPMTPCHRGCNHCCNISVILTQAEANEIGRAIGRPARQVSIAIDDEATVAQRWHGVPCPFLQANACSIYAHRPLACRLHATLADDNYMCDLAVPSTESSVPNIDLTHFWMYVGIACSNLRYGDLRDFFPGKASTATHSVITGPTLATLPQTTDSTSPN